jgi:ribosome-associated protein
MPFPVAVTSRISIPVGAVETRFVRSSGPGGQNVNKVASKVQMWIDLVLLTGATGDELALIRGKLASRLDAGGRLMVSSQATRDQGRNLEDAAARAADLIRAALVRPKVRRPTRPTGASRERRLEAKRLRAKHRQDRRITED